MTEAEWQAGSDPQPMLEVFLGSGRDRKLRLFACACVRRVWPLVRDQRARLAVEVAERFADGQATWAELQVAYHAAWEATRRFGGAHHPAEFAARDAAGFDAFAAARDAAREAVHAAQQAADWDAALAAQQDQCAILRDLMGNPFHPPPVLDPLWGHWNGDTVLRLARAIYGARAFGNLPVLADALEEAGCPEPRLVAHCRQGGEHFPGCWALDALMDRD
jgi:hypothetical protein